MTSLLPRASLSALLAGSSPLVGSRLDPTLPRGFVSPVEARLRLGLTFGDPRADEAARLAEPTPLGVFRSLASAALAASVAPRGPAVARPHLVSARVDNLSAAQALDALLAAPPATRARVVHFVHPHALNLAARDPHLQQLLARADLVLPDGIGLRLAALVLDVSLRDNLNGTDLLPPLCQRARDEQRPLVLVGAAPGVAEACAHHLRATTPGLSIPLVSHGYLDDDASTELASRIARLPAPLVLVAMGTPLQETWLWRHLAHLPGLTVLSVGGLFDFFSGRIPRAPEAWRELGLEWLFRLRCEPRRLARRYLLGNPLFLARSLHQRARGPAPHAPPPPSSPLVAPMMTSPLPASHLAPAAASTPLRRPELLALYASPCCRASLLQAPLRCARCQRPFEVVDGRPAFLDGVAPPHQGVAMSTQAAQRQGTQRTGLGGLADRLRRATTADAFADDRAQVPLLVERVAPLLPGRTLLEIGAGEQYYRRDLAPLGDLVVMDISWYGPTDLLGDAHALPLRDASIDGICVIEVLEHLARPWEFFQQAARVLRPGGVLFGVTPQYCPTHGFPHDYFRYTRAGLASLAASAGLALHDAWPLGGSWATLLRWYWANHAREHALRRRPGLNLAYHAWFQSLVALSDRLDARTGRGHAPSPHEHQDHLGWSFILRKPTV